MLALVGFLVLRGGSDTVAVDSPNDGASAEPLDLNEPDLEPEEPDEDSEPAAGTVFGDPFRPDSVAVDATSVWISDSACGAVVRIDKATEEVVGAVSVGSPGSGIAVAGGSVWVGTRDQGAVVRIDPQRMAVVGSVQVPGSALGLTAEGNDVWVTDSDLGSVYRIDAARSQVAETVQVGLDPHHIAIGPRTVWVTNQLDDTVSMIPRGRGGSEVAVTVGASPLHVELGAGSAWVTDSWDGAVSRLNQTTGDVEAVIPVGPWPHALAFANGAVWVGTETGSFWRIDPSTNEAALVQDADFASIDSAVDGNDIWIADSVGGTVVRFDAGSGSVGSAIDLREFGDCSTFTDEGFDPESIPDVAL